MQRNRICIVALTVLLALFSAVMPRTAFSQGRPDLVWMRGGQFQNITTMSYSQDGKYLVTAGDEIAVKLWRLSDGMLLRTLPIGSSAIGVAVTSDSKTIVSSDFTNTVTLFSIPDGKVLKTLSGFASPLSSMALSPDNTILALGCVDGSVHLRRLADGIEIGAWIAQSDRVYSLAFSPNGASLATGCGVGSDLTANIWRISDGSLMRSFPVGINTFYRPNGGYEVAISGSGSELVVSLKQGIVVQGWKIADGTQIWTSNILNLITATTLSADRNTFACAGTGFPAIIQLSIVDGVRLPPINAYYPMTALAYSHDGMSLAAFHPDNDVDGGIKLYNVSPGNFARALTPPGAGGWVNRLAVSPDGKTIASCTNHGSIQLRNSSDGQPYFTFGGEAASISISPDSKLCAAVVYTVRGGGHAATDVYVLRVADGSVLYDIQDGGFLRVRFTPDGQYFVASASGPQGQNPSLTAYRVSDGTPAFSLPNIISYFEFSPDGKYIITGQGGIGLYDWPAGHLVKTYDAPVGGEGDKFAWSPDSKSIVRLSAGGALTPSLKLSIPDLNVIWQSSLLGGNFNGNLRFSPDGQVIAAVSLQDSTLKFYSASDGTILTTYNQETDFNWGFWGGTGSVGYSPDGKFIYYGRGDATLCCALNPYRNAVFPTRGGNTGSVTVKVITPDIFPLAVGAIVILRASGQPDIVGAPIKLENAHVLTVMFDLNGAPLGLRDVVIINPDSSTRTYPNGFTVEPGISPELVPSVIGRTAIRDGGANTFVLNVLKTGNIDVGSGLRPSIAFDPFFDWKVEGPITPAITQQLAQNTVLIFDMPATPASIGYTFPLTLTSHAHPPVDGSTAFHLPSWISSPLTSPPPNQGFSTGKSKAGCSSIEVQVSAPTQQIAIVLCEDLAVTAVGDGSTLTIFARADDGSIGINGYRATPPGPITVELRVSAKSPGLHTWYISVDADHYPVTLYIQTTCDCGGQFGGGIAGAADPNALAGDRGYGLAQWVTTRPLTYDAIFENLPTASAPAAQVVVTDHIDATKFDTSTLQIGTISFAGKTVSPSVENALPIGTRQLNADVDMRPDKNLIVRIKAKLDTLTGDLTWTFTSIDPATNEPPTDPLAGFLDPGQEGSCLFSIAPRVGLPTGTVVSNQASIVFDFNSSIDTPVWSNTLDNDAPVSKVKPLDMMQISNSFTVSWSGTDVGSGLRDFTIYVSDNNGPWTPWQTNAATTQAIFTGLSGHTYAFYSQARDNAFNVEAAHTLSDTTTIVVGSGVSDVSGQVTVTRGGFRFNRATGRFVQTVTLTNTGGAITGPVSLVLDSLSANAGLFNKSGTTSATTPSGSPYLTVQPGDLAAGASLTVTLEFTNPTKGVITYNTRVLAGPGSL